MKKFAGNKPLITIKAQCEAARIEFDDKAFRTRGDDYIVIRGGGGEVLYNTFNGRFFGTTDTGIEFNSDSAEHDGEPWMQDLLSFFYIEKTPAPRKSMTVGQAIFKELATA